jgi:hypothetical protein
LPGSFGAVGQIKIVATSGRVHIKDHDLPAGSVFLS